MAPYAGIMRPHRDAFGTSPVGEPRSRGGWKTAGCNQERAAIQTRTDGTRIEAPILTLRMQERDGRPLLAGIGVRYHPRQPFTLRRTVYDGMRFTFTIAASLVRVSRAFARE